MLSQHAHYARSHRTGYTVGSIVINGESVIWGQQPYERPCSHAEFAANMTHRHTVNTISQNSANFQTPFQIFNQLRPGRQSIRITVDRLHSELPVAVTRQWKKWGPRPPSGSGKPLSLHYSDSPQVCPRNYSYSCAKQP